MIKKIYKYEDIKEEIVKAIDIIADPVRQTLSPKGSNVIYEDAKGDQHSTNDGVTIAKSINVENPIHNAVIEIIKQPALQTNNSVGDGTTTTILLSQTLTLEGMKLKEEGMNPMVLKDHLDNVATKIKTRLKKSVKTINGNEDLLMIAKISANNDEDIAKDVVRVVEVAGQDGLVFIEPHNKPTTELIEDTGFNIQTDLMRDLVDNGSYMVRYDDVPVLVTDKRIYYKEEAETILRTALKAGWDTVVVVARDFIGQAPNYFIANHKAGNIRVLLVKDPTASESDNTSLDDLATYLGGTLFTDKSGKIVDKLKATDFVMAKKVVANPMKTVLVSGAKNNTKLKDRIKSIRDQLKKSDDEQKLKNRLSALTNGTVTIKVGGRTPIEIQERLFRYEDSVNASRAALRDGYLVGGGLALLGAYNPKDYPEELRALVKRFCEASVRQIAENCGAHVGSILRDADPELNWGYNAKTDHMSDLLNDGVIDPYKVTEMAVDNATSIAIHLLTSGYFILNDVEALKEAKNK